MKRLNFYIVLFIFCVCLFCKPAQAIKVGLYTNVNQAYVATSKAGMFVDALTGKSIAQITPMQVYTIKNGNPYLTVSFNGKTYSLDSNYVIIKTDNSGFVFTKNKWYRGTLRIVKTGSTITVINDIDLERYLQGVVPSEMPSGWNIEAHKAQAIAARSYAIANLGKRARYGYDLKDTPEDQAYGGASSETIKTNAAVEATKGEVLVYGNKIIPAYYSASAGGYTLNAGSVWLRDLPFTKAVPSFDGNIPKRGHGVGMSQHGANTLANYGYNAYQILGYFYQNVRLYRLNVQL